jgi:sigma-B regulation protein RsbU (phosphoserine phosphatase)
MNVRPEFHLRRLDILQGISQQIAMAFQNDLLQQEMVAREGLQREIQLARQIQRTFLPEHFPEMAGWDLDVRWETARQVGGDFYDVFRIDEDRIGLVIADVSDKGIPAALYMTVARTLIRAQMSSSRSPGHVLKLVNKYLLRETPDGLFVTVVYCTLDIKTGELLYANAGHNLPYVSRNGEKKLEVLPKGGIALGVIEDPVYIDTKLQCQPGDFLFFYTDGLTETFSPNGEDFGVPRLIQILESNLDQTPIGLLSTIEDNLASFRGDEPPEDDVTLMMIQRRF